MALLPSYIFDFLKVILEIIGIRLLWLPDWKLKGTKCLRSEPQGSAGGSQVGGDGHFFKIAS